jgi:hypothetical protein
VTKLFLLNQTFTILSLIRVLIISWAIWTTNIENLGIDKWIISLKLGIAWILNIPVLSIAKILDVYIVLGNDRIWNISKLIVILLRFLKPLQLTYSNTLKLLIDRWVDI